MSDGFIVGKHQHFIRNHHHTDKYGEDQVSSRESQLGETVCRQNGHKHRQRYAYDRNEDAVPEIPYEISHFPRLTEIVEDQLFRKEALKGQQFFFGLER